MSNKMFYLIREPNYHTKEKEQKRTKTRYCVFYEFKAILQTNKLTWLFLMHAPN